MFAYCENNPINIVDPAGTFGLELLGLTLCGAIVGGIVGAAVGAAFGAINAAASGQNVADGAKAGAITGLKTGALAGAAGVLTTVATPIATAAIKIGTTVINAAIAGRSDYRSQKKAYVEKYGTESGFKCDWASVGTAAAFAGLGTAAGLELTTAANVTEIVVTGVTGGYFASAAVGAGEMLVRGFIQLLK